MAVVLLLVVPVFASVQAVDLGQKTVESSKSAASGRGNLEVRAQSGKVIKVGRSERISTITEAATLAGDGDIVEIMSGEYIAQPVVWNQANLTIRGIGNRPVMLAGGTSAEGKGIWVIRNGNIQIENIEFRGARVPDGNGAGIRFEKGHLTLQRCAFYDNEMGVLTSNYEGAVLDIFDSEFGDTPRHYSGALHHLLYVGAINRFSMVGSRLRNGFRGHLVKSRARESHIAYNLLYDGLGGGASYELEFPNGGVAFVIGNVIGQAATTDNSTLIAYGAEGTRWQKNSLSLSHNTLINEMRSGQFVDVWTRKLPSETEFVAVSNILVGTGSVPEQLRMADGGNVTVALSGMVVRDSIPSRLPTGFLSQKTQSAGVISDKSLWPVAEFKFPVGTTPLSVKKTSLPGAFQNY